MKQGQGACSIKEAESRHADAMMPALTLVELDPATIVCGEAFAAMYLAEDVRTCGEMRETCPHCKGVHLHLVLRQKDVRVAHLFCAGCTRCYDACFSDGASALNA